MLHATPDCWYDSAMTVRRGRDTLGQVRFSWLQGPATVVVPGETLQVRREGWGRSSYLLYRGDALVAVASRPSWYRVDHEVIFGSRTVTLRAPSLWKQRFVVEEDGVALGQLTRRGVFSRDVLIDLPESLPPEIGLFLLSLTVRVWSQA